MKAKAIFFVIIMLTVSRLAYAGIECESCHVMNPRSASDHQPWCPYGEKPGVSSPGSGGYSGCSGGESFEHQIIQGLFFRFIDGFMCGLSQQNSWKAQQEKIRKEEEARILAEKIRQGVAFGSALSAALNLLGNRPGPWTPPSGNEVNITGDLKPGGNSFFGVGGGPGPGEITDQPFNDPMVVDLRHLRRGSYFAQQAETATTEDVSLLLDEALRIANGAKPSGPIPSEAVLPKIDDKGLLEFQRVNADYLKTRGNLLKYAENLNTVQKRREIAYRDAEARLAEVEKNMAGKTDEASLKKKQELLAEIYASVEDEDEEWLKAKALLAVAKEYAYKAREEAVRVLRALTLGKDPAGFHPPIASIPALKEETWQDMQKSFFKERQKLDAQTRITQKELASIVPPLEGDEYYERMHEGVIIGFLTDDTNASDMEKDGVSCFNGKTYFSMKLAAKQAHKEGKEIGDAMVVSFGTPEQKEKDFNRVIDAVRVAADHFTVGTISLLTPQGRKAVKKLAGKKFDRLIAHSNGATVAEALIWNKVIKVDELDIMGGDRSLLNRSAYQQLVDSGRVKRIVVWINLNDVVPWSTSVLQLGLQIRVCTDAAMHLAKKIVGNDTRVSYRFMWGADYEIKTAPTGILKKAEWLIAPHYLETSYYPGVAYELGVKYAMPERLYHKK